LKKLRILISQKQFQFESLWRCVLTTHLSEERKKKAPNKARKLSKFRKQIHRPEALYRFSVIYSKLIPFFDRALPCPPLLPLTLLLRNKHACSVTVANDVTADHAASPRPEEPKQSTLGG
jgi:hypothetical protein